MWKKIQFHSHFEPHHAKKCLYKNSRNTCVFLFLQINFTSTFYHFISGTTTNKILLFPLDTFLHLRIDIYCIKPKIRKHKTGKRIRHN